MDNFKKKEILFWLNDIFGKRAGYRVVVATLQPAGRIRSADQFNPSLAHFCQMQIYKQLWKFQLQALLQTLKGFCRTVDSCICVIDV